MQAEAPQMDHENASHQAILSIGEHRYSMFLPNAATDYIQKKIATEQRPYELQMLEDILTRVQVDDLVLDIGANIGNHTMYLAAVAGCRVVAFEPNRALAQALVVSVQANDLVDRVSVRAQGVGSSGGRGRFGQDMPDNLGGQSLTLGEGDIPIVVLDELDFEQPVKLLKIDVEGMEMAVLQGADALLSRDRPLIYVECMVEADFRAVASWLDARGYSYWDTFNATPTHLFVPCEQVGTDQRLARLQFKNVLDTYRTHDQLSATRVRLEEANVKYRSANESIDRLKQRLHDEGQQHLTALSKLDVAKTELTVRLEEASGKYRQSMEQITSLKEAVAAAGQARSAVEAKLAKVEDELAIVRASRESLHQERLSLIPLVDANNSLSVRLEEANIKYRHSTEQVRALKVELESAARLRQEMATLQTQLDTQDRNGRELSRQVSSLEGQLAQEQAARHEVESQLLATRHAAEQELREQQLHRDAIEQQCAVLQEQLSLLEQQRAQQLAVLGDELMEERELRQESENALLASRKETEETCLQVDALQARLAQDAVALDALQDQLIEEAGHREAAQEQLARTVAEGETLQERLSQEQAARELVQDQLTEETGHREAAQEQQARAVAEGEALQLQLSQEQAARELVQEQLTLEQADREALQAELVLACTQREALEAQLRVASEQWSATRLQFEGEMELARSNLETANQKYRNVAGEQIPHLKSNITSLQARSAEQQKKLQELNDNLKRANAKRQDAEQRLIKTRASLTYQLGYRIKAGATSLSGLVLLPKSLFGLYREASRRRKVARQKALSRNAQIATLPTPASAPVDAAQRPKVLGTEAQARALMPVADKGKQQTRVACIMDEFSFGSYRHECDLLQLTPADWQREMETFRPQMLLIESAWRGKDDLWGSKVGHNSQELQGILAWCRDNGVPTAFWNKEDPVHFETFLTTAKQFDHVFTTDIDCIHRYKAGLGHERVYLLPFACQPAVHNPIELFQRKDAFCFAGAYYLRYPDRTRDLGNFVAELPKLRPLEIYDRNFGKDDANYQFPAKYQPYIVGTLPFDQIDTAYKGYRYAINLNSIKQSQSMFARRVFELLGSNTITVSNFSRGARLLFGDLVVTTDNGPEMVRRLNLLAGSEEDSGKLRLAALRKVMQEHTYAQRMNYVQSKVLQRSASQTLPAIAVLARADDSAALERVLQAVARQSLQPQRISILVSAALKERAQVADSRIVLLTEKELKKRRVGELAGDAEMIVGLHSDDYYGANYLLDIALATRYSRAAIIGKAARFFVSADSVQLQGTQPAYCPVASLPVRASAIQTQRVSDQLALDWFAGLADRNYEGEGALSIDPYNYCRDGAGTEVSSRVDDLVLNTGLSIDDLQARAEAIEPAQVDLSGTPQLAGLQLESLFGPLRSKAVRFELEGQGWKVDSELADGKHEYLYATQDLMPEQLGDRETLKLFLDTTPGLNLQLVLLMLDEQKQRITHVMAHANRNITVDVPPEAAFIRLGWRVYASGSAEIKGLLLGHRDLQPSAMLERSRHLLLTNHYPAYDDLYRNGFVHSRVCAYREKGVAVDVFRLRKDQAVSYHEFEDTDVITGSQETLDRMLGGGRFDSVLVHFLDPDMWEVLRKHTDRLRVVVWVHGAEVQPWWRREYNYSTDEQLQLAKLESDKRLAFWRGLLQPMPSNLRLVFVSRYFAEEVMEDLGFRLPESQYSIIHNPISTDLFSYQPKGVEQRGKILSIRPYASAKYANDLSARTIELLAERPFFKDLEFRMIGDGPLFDEILEPLRKYPNVTIERGFLKQPQIAALHKEYGVFLCPTRMDAQGVSRDEAMSSGLVPVTNGVTAIPEFVDQSSGILAAGDNAEEMAEGIAMLYLQPEKFEAMSREAAQRVRRQTASELVVAQELNEIAGIR